MKLRGLLLLLVAAYALAVAQHVRAATTRDRMKNAVSLLANADGSGSGASEVGASISSRNAKKNVTQLFGGRKKEKIPSLGEFRRNVALLLQPREEETEQLQGCITIAIAPRFFITRASCVRGQDNTTRLFVESDQNMRTSLAIKSTTEHPDFFVNLAIVEVEDCPESRNTTIQPMPLSGYTPSYYLRDDALSMISIDKIFNPALAKNPQTVDKLIRVPVRSCQYNSDPSSVNCFAPAKLADRDLVYEFGQGMLLHKKEHLVGLPECEGLCSGGMFYSITHLAIFQSWIDEVTSNAVQWILSPAAKRVSQVPPEDEPAVVSLLESNSARAQAVCGGSLIAPRYVLTTASCAANHSIVVARVNHGKRPSGPDGQDDTIGIMKITYHPQYANLTSLSNDLAIIQLTGPTFYTPTILASDDALNSKPSPDPSCANPRRSGVDTTIMCLPPSLTEDFEPDRRNRRLQSSQEEDIASTAGADGVEDFSFSFVESPSSSKCQQLKIEQWNKKKGDSIFDVPDTGSYYLLGVSTGMSDMIVKVGRNQTQGRVCSMNETVGDDDNATLVVRLATPQTIDFIDSVSADHTWRNPHDLPASIFASRLMRTGGKVESTTLEPFSVPDYTGPLEFEEPPKNQDLGFVVGLRIEKFGQNFCGGSLIAPSYVLTAAHCLAGDRARFVSVGSHESAGAETEVIPVKMSNIVVHPLYGKHSAYSYDVAILELESQAYPKPITLDNSRELNPSTYLTLYGYGADSASSTKLSDVLRSVDLPYFPRDKCKTKFQDLDESMFCAGGELARDACTGDSGSPLVRVVNGKPQLVGVVSSGRSGCGTPGTPGVYAFVAEVQDFINSIVAGSKWVEPSKATSSSLKLPTGGGSDPRMTPENESRTVSSGSDGTVLRSSGLNLTDLPFEIINMANGAVAHQLSIVEMAKETPTNLQAALMEFLIGNYEFVDGWRPQVDEHWKIAYYSTGDLTELMKTIAQHRSKPLYSRQNRFGRDVWSKMQGAADDRAFLSARACP